VLVFCREGPGLAGIGETFPNGKQGECDEYALQHERPVEACIISCYAERHADGRVQVKNPGIPDAMWVRYSRLGI